MVKVAKSRIDTQTIVRGISAVGQAFSAAAGAAKVFGDESSTGAEKANAAFSTVQGTISAIGTAVGGPFGMAVSTAINGVLSFIKEVTPLGSILENIFSST